MTPNGLYCPAGNFHIDPNGKVDTAVVTHAHSDHARRGSREYHCTTPGLGVLKARIGQNISVNHHAYGEAFYIRGVKLSFHSAGHILGSAQVRIEFGGEVWVASGDYKREPDGTCAPFEPVPCDVFITEATFGTPGFVWGKDIDLGKQIHDWHLENQAAGKNSVVLAYSLGKAQRVLNLLHPWAKEPIFCDAATSVINDCYRDEKVILPETIQVTRQTSPVQSRLFVVPPSFLRGEFAPVLGDDFETAFASGWSKRPRWGNSHPGFILSDHADWNDLLKTVLETGAKRVYVQHRGSGALVRRLNSLGIKAYSDSALFPKNPQQLSLL
ncbi:MAG: ligase-associated DNA damage response exonuclease [Myxococcota bacterium]